MMTWTCSTRSYVEFSIEDNRECYEPAGARDYCDPAFYAAVPDRLLRNDGDGRFSDVYSERRHRSSLWQRTRRDLH